MNESLLEEANQRAAWFKSRGQGMMSHMMLSECEQQFIEMAQGGDGTCTMQGNIRKDHYSGKPDAFFQHICDELGWIWRE